MGDDNTIQMGFASLRTEWYEPFKLKEPGSLSSSIFEKIGSADSSAILGAEGGASYNLMPGTSNDRLYISPLDVFWGIPFGSDERPSFNNKNGITFIGGFLNAGSEYGGNFPIIGGGCDLYLETDYDNMPISGRGEIRYGKLGSINSDEKKYDDVSVKSGSLRLNAALDDRTRIGGGGIYGSITKKDNYLGDWEDSFQGPDIYDKFYGFSANLSYTEDPLNLRLAYYFLRQKGAGNFDALDSYIPTNDSVTDDSHRFSGDLSYMILREKRFSLSSGVHANYFTGDRADQYNFDVSDEGARFADSGMPVQEWSVLNAWNDKRKYANVFLQLGLGTYSIELGGGYMENQDQYQTDCYPLCETPDYSSKNTIKNIYAQISTNWGQPE